MDLSEFLRAVPDFPIPGIEFQDIAPLLNDPDAFSEAVTRMSVPFADAGVTVVCGIDARGFVFGPSVAQQLDAGFMMIRKPGKLPGKTTSVSYDLEYGSDGLEIQEGLLDELDRVLLIDDVLATGGTLSAACELIATAGAQLVGVSVVVDLVELNGRAQLPDVSYNALIEVS